MKFGVKNPSSTNVFGLCFSLLRMASRMASADFIEVYSIDDLLIETLFPEMLQFKPAEFEIPKYWWDFTEEGYRKRVNVCNEIIKKLEYKK